MTDLFTYAARVINDLEKAADRNRAATGRWHEGILPDESVSPDSIRAHFQRKLTQELQQTETELDMTLMPEQRVAIGNRDIFHPEQFLNETEEKNLSFSEQQHGLYERYMDLYTKRLANICADISNSLVHRFSDLDLSNVGKNERTVLAADNSITEAEFSGNPMLAVATAELLNYALCDTCRDRWHDAKYRVRYDDSTLSWQLLTNDQEPSLDFGQLRNSLNSLRQDCFRADQWRHVPTAKGGAYEFESRNPVFLLHTLVSMLGDASCRESFFSYKGQRISADEMKMLRKGTESPVELPEGVTRKTRVYGPEVKRLLIGMLGIDGIKEIPSARMRLQ